MPSRIFAALPRQIDKLTASPAQYDEENSPPPVLQEVDIVYELEYALDFQGNKHLDRESSVERFTFGVQEDVSTSYPEYFPMPGLTSADTLRDFLRQRLQPYQIFDEYGDECELSDISNDHLPVLQAKMWAKAFNNRSPVKAVAQRPSRAQILIAGHVAKIAQLLEYKHIFVFSDDTTNDSCNYLNNLQVTPENHACHSKIVRIEPLVHWGTLTPAGPSHFALPFRRDGELMKQPVEQPGYAQLVKRLVIDAPAYCIDCLGYLWDKRAEARGVMRQLQGTVPRPQSLYPEDTSPLRPVLKLKSSGFGSRDVGTLAIGETMGTAANSITPAVGEPQDHTDELDGAFDRSEEIHTGHSSGNGQDNNAVWISSDGDEPIEEHIVLNGSLHRADTFTIPLRPTSPGPKSSSGDSIPLAPPTKQLSSTATKFDTARASRETGSNVTKTKRDTQIIDLRTPPRAKERKFGRELDNNAKAPIVPVRRSPRNHKTKSQEIRAVPVKPMQLLKSVQNTKAESKETRKRKTAPKGKQTGKQKKALNVARKNFIPLSPMRAAPKDPRLSQSKLRTISTAGLHRVPKPESCSPPKLIVHFAKRSETPQIPDDIAEEEWAAFQSTHPAPKSKICWCNKPASYGTSKKKDDPQIAQCTNKECRIRWLHYACLNLSEKGKARFGTLLCSVCRVEQDFADQNRKIGWSAEKLMDFPLVYTKDDVKAKMPGLGGVIPEANTYGLGLEVQLGPKYDNPIKETGTLGGLDKMGFPQSHPEIVEEAYMHAGAYAELLARRAEEDEGDEWGDKIYTGEEEYDYDEEVYGEEMDEGL